MKLYLYLTLLLSALFISNAGNAQTTINNTIGTTGYTGNNGAGAGYAVTFVVINNSGGGINLTDVANWWNLADYTGSQAVTLYYSTTSLSGPYGTLVAPAWTQVATGMVTLTTTGVQPALSGMSFLIPNGATYRFALYCAGYCRYSGISAPFPAPNSITAGGVTLAMGDYQIAAQPVGYGSTNANRFFTGSITFVTAGPPCPPPTNVQVNNILSSSATGTWSPVSGSFGYDYFVDQNATPPPTPTFSTTTGTSANFPGLTPGTGYYLHVRNKCAASNYYSTWVDAPFTTLPPCNNPSGFNTTNLFETSTTINWAPLASAISWDYIVDQTYGTPSSSTGATNVTSPTDNLTGLMGNTKYYVHIRANCTGEQSGWSLDSFTTPLVCNSPVIMIDHINTNEAVAYWEKVPTAYQYEYALTQSATSPVSGTKIMSQGIHLPALNDGRKYYIHVRSHCNSLGSLSESAWAFADFSTFALDIDHTSTDGFSFSVYPNPANNLVTIDVKGSLSNSAGYTISDLYGKTIKQARLTSAKTEVNISELPVGIYMLKYTDGQHDKVIRIIKQ